MNRIPLKEFFNDWGLTATHIIGNTLIGVFFFAIGVCILLYAKHAKNKSLAQWVAWCFMLCAISRAVFVLLIWYDLYVLAGITTAITGLTSIPTTVFIMLEAHKINQIKELKELEKDITEVQEKLETLKTMKDENTNPGDTVV